MKKVIAKAEAFAHQGGEEGPVAAGLVAYLKSLTVFLCKFCGGVGHTAKDCPTKKNVDRACKYNP